MTKCLWGEIFTIKKKHLKYKVGKCLLNSLLPMDLLKENHEHRLGTECRYYLSVNRIKMPNGYD